MRNLWYLFRLIISGIQFDIKSGRIRAAIFIGFANILPDLIMFAYIRPLLWRLAGASIPICGGCAIRKNVWIDFPQYFNCGSNVSINRGTIISAHGGVTVECNVAISFYVGIHSIYHQGAKHEIDVMNPILIKSGAIIYSHAVLLPGCVVNNRAVITAGSILAGEAMADHVYSGNPARKVIKRSDLGKEF